MKTEEKFFLGALIGSALGAAAALLFAPVAGEKLRKKILNNFYQPLNIPKRKIFSPKRARTLSKAKTQNHQIAEEKGLKRSSRKTVSRE